MTLHQGIGTATIHRSARPRRGKTDWSATTTVALPHPGYQPGDTVTKRQSRKAYWAQGSLPITQPESWITFRVVKDANPTKHRKDRTWSRYSFRAWDVPQVAGTGNHTEEWHGRLANHQSTCGYRTNRQRPVEWLCECGADRSGRMASKRYCGSGHTAVADGEDTHPKRGGGLQGITAFLRWALPRRGAHPPPLGTA